MVLCWTAGLLTCQVRPGRCSRQRCGRTRCSLDLQLALRISPVNTLCLCWTWELVQIQAACAAGGGGNGRTWNCSIKPLQTPTTASKNSFESARAARGLGRFLLRCRRRGWHLGGPYYHTFTSEADTSQRKRIDPRGCVSTEAYPSRMEKYEDRLQLPNFKPISICALGLQSSRQPWLCSFGAGSSGGGGGTVPAKATDQQRALPSGTGISVL